MVLLRHDDGWVTAYAHNSSLLVKKGDKVGQGQVIARVGNTGPSGAPHLHLQVMDGPDLLASDGLPFVFRRFALAGDVTNLGEFLTGAAPAVLRPSPRTGVRRSELPLQSAVVRFHG